MKFGRGGSGGLDVVDLLITGRTLELLEVSQTSLARRLQSGGTVIDFVERFYEKNGKNQAKLEGVHQDEIQQVKAKGK